MKNSKSWCEYNNTTCQVISFANKRQPSKTKVAFMSTAYILFYIQSGTEELPAIQNGVFSDPEIFNENENEKNPSVPIKVCFDIEVSSQSEGEGQLTCAICSQVI
jgi:hypothetical protein